MSVLHMSQDLHLIPRLYQFQMPTKDEESVAGFVIQATATLEFEDDLKERESSPLVPLL